MLLHHVLNLVDDRDTRIVLNSRAHVLRVMLSLNKRHVTVKPPHDNLVNEKEPPVWKKLL